jgi:hypothetical protein
MRAASAVADTRSSILVQSTLAQARPQHHRDLVELPSLL